MKTSRYLIALYLFFLTSTSFSNETTWVSPKNTTNLTLNKIRFTNRAQCAIDSKYPTDSFFLLVNNLDQAKAVYRLAQATGSDTSTLTKMSIKRFRFTVLQLLELIHQKIIDRQLPLLPADTTTMHVPDHYKKIMHNCRSDQYCTELDQYIERLWNISNKGISSSEKVIRFYEIDNFHSKENFITNKLFKHKKKELHLNCLYLKKFSPLQAHLYGTKPNQKALIAMGKALLDYSEYVAGCYDDEQQKSIKVASYQLEIPNLRDKKWKKQGFDYWNSVKLYFSWAFRNAPEMKQMMGQFYHIFRNIAVEEAVMFAPNGCKSITPPKCDSQFLSQNTIREFAKNSFKANGQNLDILSALPEGPEHDLLENSFTDVNHDILNLSSQENAEAWAENLNQNYSRVRNYMKGRLIRAYSDLNIIFNKLSINDIKTGLQNYFAKIKKDSFENDKERADLKNELYYLCSEYSYVAHKDLSFVKNKISILKDLKTLDGLMGNLTDLNTKQIFESYEQLAKIITNGCDNLNQRQIWNDTFTLDKTGFSPWYIEKVYENKFTSTQNDQIIDYLKNHKPLLAFSSYNTTQSNNDVICAHGSHCARKIVADILSLYAVALYVDTFWTTKQKLNSPNLFNPYAERTACKVYDPWFKLKSTLVSVMGSLAQSGLAATNPGYIYGSLTLKPGRVVSFNRLVKDGKISFDSNYEQSRVQTALVTNFGPLLGVPCTVSIARQAYNPYNYYRFSGISVGACHSREAHNLVVYSASDLTNRPGPTHAECVSCTINFESITDSIGHFVTNIGSKFFLFNALFKIYGLLKDPKNIPHNWTADPNYILETYRRFNTIPKQCVKRLRKGRRCLLNNCEEAVAASIQRSYRGNITEWNITPNSYNSYVKIDSCNEPIKISIEQEGDPTYGQCSAYIIKKKKTCRSALR